MNEFAAARAKRIERLKRLDREELQSIVERLAGDSEDIADRVDYLLDRNAAAERLTLRIAALGHNSQWVPYTHVSDMADVVTRIADDIESDVLPFEPTRALALVEQLMDLETALLDRAQDDGFLSDALGSVCTRWLKIARVARDKGEPPNMDWVARLLEILRHDSYSVRRNMWREANLLLDESELRSMASELERSAVASGLDGLDAEEARTTRSTAIARMQELARALRDPELYDRSEYLRRQNPGDIQIEEMVRFHLECGDVSGALRLLKEPWNGYRETTRLALLDLAYGQIGDKASQIEVRRRRFQELPCVWTYRALAELLEEPELETLRADAKSLAQSVRDVGSAAQLLFAAGHCDAAQSLLVVRSKELEKSASNLESLAHEAADQGYVLAAVAIWRAMTSSVLNRAASKAYHHAADYFAEACRLDRSIEDHLGLPTHAQYVNALRQQHGRKTAFWSRVSET